MRTESQRQTNPAGHKHRDHNHGDDNDDDDEDHGLHDEARTHDTNEARGAVEEAGREGLDLCQSCRPRAAGGDLGGCPVMLWKSDAMEVRCYGSGCSFVH